MKWKFGRSFLLDKQLSQLQASLKNRIGTHDHSIVLHLLDQLS